MTGERKDEADVFWAWLRGCFDDVLAQDLTPAEAEARLAAAPEQPLLPDQVERIVVAATATSPTARPWWGRHRLAVAAGLLVSLPLVAAVVWVIPWPGQQVQP